MSREKSSDKELLAQFVAIARAAAKAAHAVVHGSDRATALALCAQAQEQARDLLGMLEVARALLGSGDYSVADDAIEEMRLCDLVMFAEELRSATNFAHCAVVGENWYRPATCLLETGFYPHDGWNELCAHAPGSARFGTCAWCPWRAR